MWRDNPDDDGDPEIAIWKEAALESGQAYWYDDDGNISLRDPFDPDWDGPEPDDDDDDE